MVELQNDAQNRQHGTGSGNTRRWTSYIPLTTALLGITLVITSVVFFFVEDDMRRLVWVTVGLGVLVTSVWFAAHPLVVNSRRFLALRTEVESFLKLVRTLNRQSALTGGTTDVERTRARMHEAVERIVAKAGDATSSEDLGPRG